MTREAKLLIDMWDTLHRECHKVVTEENYDVIKKAIKALEQENAIEKILAEVKSINLWALRYAPTYDEDIRPQIVSNVKEHVLQIIDKYREG